MPCRYYIWAVVILFSSCASLLDRKSDFERGLISYNNLQFREAAGYFAAYHKEHPDSDSTLYYLYNCYSKLNEPENQIMTLEKLAGRSVNDPNIYLNLTFLYRKHERYGRMYNMLSNIPKSVSNDMNRHLILTRRLLAELICGTSTRKIKTDPMVYCITRKYLPLFPDGNLYEEDTLTVANLIVLFDRLIEPEYPLNLYPMKNISTRSYLYLPYMRLVEIGAMELDPYLMPGQNANFLFAIKALNVLATKGYLD
ncbi:MAG: hypothetical protein JSV53_02395 [candidate division WOR-3 bacterium]|nr:MAG: hypothetical protein JSV53_02395 [candidate division WOR-3 bacterium]